MGMKKSIEGPTYLDPRRVGESLREVAVDIIKTESQNVVSRWFHSDLDVDLFIWLDEKNNIIKQQLSFCGQIVEWNIIEGIKTGLVVEEEATSGDIELETDEKKESGSQVIRFDKHVEANSVKLALNLVNYIDSIVEDDKDALLQNFSEEPKAENMDPEEFVSRYGNVPRKTQKIKPLNLWKRVKMWLSGGRG